MKKIFFLLIPALMFSQKVQKVRTIGSIKDNSGISKNLNVIDKRKDQDLGTIDYKNQKTQFVFTDENATNFFENWYKKSNKDPKGSDNLVLLLENIKIYDEPEGGKSHLKADLKASAFLEKNGQYYFVKRINSTENPNQDFPNSPAGISLTVSLLFYNLIKASYSLAPSAVAISAENLSGYETILSTTMPAFKNDIIKDGVYKDFESFFSQNPADGYQLIKNKDNEVTKVKKGDETLNRWKIYAYAENGKVYKNTPSGFMEMTKDEKGFFVVSNRGTLAPVQMDSTYGMFGLVGAGIGVIATNEKNKKLLKAEK